MQNPMTVVDARVVTDPAIHAGEPAIGGTSTPVRAIAELWNQGMPAEEIPVHLPHLQLVHVFEALRYYAGAALKCPVAGLFRVTIAERGWTRRNGLAIGSRFEMSGGRPVSRDNDRTRPDKTKWPRHRKPV